MTDIRITQESHGLKTVRWSNGVLLGSFVCHEDGYWYFWTEPGRNGGLEARVLRAIADALDESNRGWDERVRREIGE